MSFGGSGHDSRAANWVKSVVGGVVNKTGPYLFNPNRADGNKVGGSTGSHVKLDGEFPDIVGGHMWQNRDSYENYLTDPNVPNKHNAGATAYAVENGLEVVYVNAKPLGQSRFHLYRYTLGPVDDPKQDRWELVGLFRSGPTGSGAGAYDANSKVFVRSARSTAAIPNVYFYYWDLSQPLGPGNENVTIVPEDPSGQFYSIARGGMGLDYDPVRDQFVVWPGDGSGRVWVLRPPQPLAATGWRLELQPEPVDDVPPELPLSSGGVVGKWKYAINLDTFVALENPTEGNVWLYKPVGWQRPDGQLPEAIFSDQFELSAESTLNFRIE